MAYISDRTYKVTGVTGTTATLQPNDAAVATANEPVTQIVLTWAVRPVEITVGTILVNAKIRTA